MQNGLHYLMNSSVDVPEGALLAYGNPLLDVSVNDDSLKELLQKYGLKENDAILADSQHVPLYQELVDKYPDKVEYIPGGATLNAIRAVQWILGKPKVATYFGCISKDRFGEIIKNKSEQAGVNVQFQFTDKEPTGTCGVLCTGNNRSLVANLAAANCFTADHLDVNSNWALVEKAKVFYTAGFPLTVSPESMMRLAKHAKDTNKTYCLNLSAPFLCTFFKEPMMELMPYVDILFGSEMEADEFGKVHNLGSDRKDIALKIAQLPKENERRSRTVIITQGADPVIVAKDGSVKEYPVSALPLESIVDTNGAGDGFVGGFLAQYLLGKSMDECIHCGMYVGNVIVQASGFTLPPKADYSYS